MRKLNCRPNDVFLMSINQDLGKALEELIPSAFDSDGMNIGGLSHISEIRPIPTN